MSRRTEWSSRDGNLRGAQEGGGKAWVPEAAGPSWVSSDTPLPRALLGPLRISIGWAFIGPANPDLRATPRQIL